MGCRCLRKQTVSLFAQQQYKYSEISEIKHKSQQLFVFYLREYFLFATLCDNYYGFLTAVIS